MDEGPDIVLVRHPQYIADAGEIRRSQFWAIRPIEIFEWALMHGRRPPSRGHLEQQLGDVGEGILYTVYRSPSIDGRYIIAAYRSLDEKRIELRSVLVREP